VAIGTLASGLATPAESAAMSALYAVLATMEVGFLCPPAGLNSYFASAMFGKSVRYVAASVAPAMGAIFVGTLLIAVFPWLATALPSWLGSS